MDIAAIHSLSAVGKVNEIKPLSEIGMISTDNKSRVNGTMFENFLNTAIDNIKTTNSYLSDAENEEIRFALGEVNNTHDMAIALQKASTALQYTVAVRDRLMDAYKELMQMQI